MKKTFKKIAASVMAAATLAVGAAGMTASATNDYFFAFNLGTGGQNSTTGTKSNYLSYASVNITETKYMSDSAYMDFCLKNASGTKISDTARKTTKGSFRMYYTTTTPAINSKVTLQGNAGYYRAQASGDWTP